MEKTQGLREGYSPLAWAVVLAAAVSPWAISGDRLDDVVDKVVPAMVTVAAVLSALEATARSILLALVESPVVKRLKALNLYQRLMDYFDASGRTLMRFIAVALLVMFVRGAGLSPHWLDRVIPSAVVFFFVHAWCCTLRLQRIMIKILLRKDLGVPYVLEERRS